MGCITLVMACAFCAGWVRSQYASDLLAFPAFGRQLVVKSIPNRIVLESWRGNWVDNAEWALEFDSVDANEMEDVLAQESGYSEYKEVVAILWVIPYWLVTLPLTLLAAHLILWKPRKTK